MDWTLVADFKEIAARLPSSAWMTAGGFTLVAFLAGMAFTSGVMSQLVNMVSIASGIVVSWWVFRHRTEVFGSSAIGMGVDRLLIFSLGIGIVAYVICRILAKVLAGFGIIKLAGLAGWKGMFLSLIPSGILIWMGSLVLRFLGNLYGLESASHIAAQGNKFQGQFGEFFLEARRMLDRSPFGSLLNNVDPLAMQRTGNLARLLIVWPEGRLWPHLKADPHTGKVFAHPKVAALGHDPAVRNCISRKDYPGLLQLNVVELAASHPDLEPILTSAALEASMDRIIYGRGGR
jgi:hypothetical protein